MPAFFSDKANLVLPEYPHSDDPRYEPVGSGKPLCLEILHISFGNVKDWLGKAEILVSSWAKTGGSAKPAPRAINVMRKNVSTHEHLSDFGAADYGHQLVYYTPSYGGETLRFSLEFLEIDALRKKGVEALGKGLKELSRLAVFVPQLTYLSLAPEAMELGRKLYNIFNQNDLILLEHLDLSLGVPDSKVLTSGRFVLVNGNHSSSFIDKFKLDFDNRLKTKDGKLAEKAGMEDAYVVIRINAQERNEYKDFEVESEAQQILEEFLSQKTITENIADLISDSVKAAKQFHSVEEILKLKKNLNREGEEDKKRELKEKIENELKKLSDDQVDLLKDALGL